MEHLQIWDLVAWACTSMSRDTGHAAFPEMEWRSRKSRLGRCPILHRESQVTIIQLFMALFRCDNNSLIWSRVLCSRQSCGGGASRGTPDACSQAICPHKPLTSFPGKTLGTLTESSCLNFKRQNDLAPLPFSPIPPTSWSCGEAEISAFAVLWVSGSAVLESPPHPTWETYSHLVVIVLRTGNKKKERKNKQLTPQPRQCCLLDTSKCVKGCSWQMWYTNSVADLFASGCALEPCSICS